MKNSAKLKIIATVAFAGLAFGVFKAIGDGHESVLGLDTWKSGKNHNRIIRVQNEGAPSADGEAQAVRVAYYSNSAFQLTSPSGITVMVDPWRNDPSGAWGLWYRMDFPKVEVDIGMSTHAHFDHDAIGALEANMLLDRMAGAFKIGDVSITGIADKHQCVAPGVVVWTDAVKQFEGRDDVCPPTNARHFDNNIYVIETGGMRFLMWGDNRPNPPQEVWERIGEVDVIFVPVDGSKHILDYDQADEVVQKSGAKIAVPHHYLVPTTTFVTSTLQSAEEWTMRHPHTMLEAAYFDLSPEDLDGKEGHVYYFGENNMVAN